MGRTLPTPATQAARSSPPYPPDPTTQTRRAAVRAGPAGCAAGPPTWEGQAMNARPPASTESQPPEVRGPLACPGVAWVQALNTPASLGAPRPPEPTWCGGYSGCKFSPGAQWECGPSEGSPNNTPVHTHFPSEAQASSEPLCRRANTPPAQGTTRELCPRRGGPPATPAVPPAPPEHRTRLELLGVRPSTRGGVPGRLQGAV